eukprot:487975_1
MGVSQLVVCFIITICINHGTCYVFINQRVTYDQAASYCQINCNSELASIHSQQQFDQILAVWTDRSTGAWIGLEKKLSVWQWNDGTPFDWSKWGSGEPNGDGSCGHLGENTQGQWNDLLCTNNMLTIMCNSCPPTTDIPTVSPTLSPTACPLVNGEFCGYTLFVKGYNIFTSKTSGNAITDINYIEENTESWTDEGSTCSLSSLEFTTSFTSYSQYASYDTQSIGAGFSTSKYGAGGSLSTTRTQTKYYSSLSQSYIYVLDLTCVSAVASVVAYNEIIWSANFVNNLRILPISLTDTGTIISTNDLDLLEPWIDFWNAFGTHLISTAELGGSIHGTITADKCNVEHMFSNSQAYQVCLNGAYKGISVEGCYEEGYSSSSGDNFQSSVTNTQITVKGGDNSQFTNVFNQFGSKENDFQFWITQLQEFPDIIGGNLDEIHDVIQQTIKLGNHKLNNHLSAENYVDDNTWIAIADAMESAYNAYSQYLKDNDPVFGDTQCSLNCQEGEVETLSCSCNLCNDNLGCCPERADNAYYTDIVVNILFITFVLLA